MSLFPTKVVKWGYSVLNLSQRAYHLYIYVYKNPKTVISGILGETECHEKTTNFLTGMEPSQ